MTTTSRNVPQLSIAILLLLITAHSVTAAEWGSIKGRFVVDGAPPQLPPPVVTKDQFCIDSKPKNDKVVVGKDNGLVYAVVYAFVGRGAKIDVHPEYEEARKKPVTLDNNHCSFQPHIVTVRTDQPLAIKNSDPVGHNTNTGLYNQTIGSGETTTITYDKVTSPLPLPVSCGIHPFMKGYLLVQEHPYMMVSGEDGSFEIKNIPVGEREFQFWHETGYLIGVKLPKGATDRRGRAKLTIEAGKTLDLGDIKVPASLLKR